jgi:hypothetical protein
MRGDCGCLGHFEPQLSPDLTKYLSLDATASITRTSWDFIRDPETGMETGRTNVVTVESEMTSASSVDRYSGIETGSCTHSGDDIEILQGLLGHANDTMEQLRGAYCTTLSYYAGYDISYSGTSATIQDIYGQTIVTNTLDQSAGTWTYTVRGRFEYGTPDNPIIYYVDVIRVSLTITATGVTWSRYVYEELAEVGSTYEESMSATFSSPYTSADVNYDVDGMIDTWEQAVLNDAQYPWRVDAGWNRGPLVTRNETAGMPMIHGVPGNYTSGSVPRPGRPAGDIIGLPNPAGYEPYFDFSHLTWELFDMTNDAGEQWRVTEYGEYCPPEYPCATQWLDNRQSQFIPAGPFASYGAFKNPTTYTTVGCPIGEFPGLLKCAWFEVIMFAVPSHNFARPCGPTDKAAVNWDGDCLSTPTLRWPSVPCHCDDPTVTTGCESQPKPATEYVWNDRTRKGEYLFKSFSFDFRDWREAYADRAASWGMASREDCTGSTWTPMNPIRYVENPAWWEGFWWEGEWILGGDTIQSGSLWLKTATTTQACVEYSHCSPTVAYCAPSEYQFAGNSVRHEWPALACDEGYGALWLGRIQQWTPDPLWRAPGTLQEIQRLCDSDCMQYLPDDGSCLPDDELLGICYYPIAPFVESRNSLPPGAPALPADAFNFFCTDVVAKLNQDPPVGSHSSCYPLYGYSLVYDREYCGGYVLYGGPSGYIPPWVTLLKMEQCVRASGRFAEQYRKNGIII